MSEPVPFTHRARLVWIEWEDAASHNTGWVEWGGVPLTAEPVVTVGFVLAENAERILIASTVATEGTNGHFSIPRGMITRLVELDRPL